MKNQPSGSKLEEAIQKKDLEAIKELLNSGMDPKGEYNDPITQATRQGDCDIIQLLINAGADIHERNDDPIRIAISYSHFDAVKLLLESGAIASISDNFPLRIAASRAQSQTVKLLLQYGACFIARNHCELLNKEENKFQDTIIALIQSYPTKEIQEINIPISKLTKRIIREELSKREYQKKLTTLRKEQPNIQI